MAKVVIGKKTDADTLQEIFDRLDEIESSMWAKERNQDSWGNEDWEDDYSDEEDWY